MNSMDGVIAIIGFDSAWADKARGAICALVVDAEGAVGFKPPELASFDQALGFIETESLICDDCVVAVDQPTIVPNKMGCRPVDRVAGSLISFIGGGVQPANRSKQGLFDDNAPFWRFKVGLGATEDPERSRTAITGRFIIEVSPRLPYRHSTAPSSEGLEPPSTIQRTNASLTRGLDSSSGDGPAIRAACRDQRD